MYIVFKLITGECAVVSPSQFEKINSRASYRDKILWSIQGIESLEYALTLVDEFNTVETWEAC
jgi:hypothetical protein